MFKRILSCPFFGRQKVQVTKFAFDDFIFVVGNLPRTRAAQRLSSQYFAAVPTSNIAELVPSGFFCPQPWFLRRSEHIFLRKTAACLFDRPANIHFERSGRLVDWLERFPSIQALWGSNPREEFFFSFFFFSFFLFLGITLKINKFEQ